MFHARLRTAVPLAGAAGLLATGLLNAAVAGATELSTPPAEGLTVTRTLTAGEHGHALPVPDGVTTVDVTVLGGAPGAEDVELGRTTFPVAPGGTLLVDIGTAEELAAVAPTAGADRVDAPPADGEVPEAAEPWLFVAAEDESAALVRIVEPSAATDGPATAEDAAAEDPAAVEMPAPAEDPTPAEETAPVEDPATDEEQVGVSVVLTYTVPAADVDAGTPEGDTAAIPSPSGSRTESTTEQRAPTEDPTPADEVPADEVPAEEAPAEQPAPVEEVSAEDIAALEEALAEPVPVEESVPLEEMPPLTLPSATDRPIAVQVPTSQALAGVFGAVDISAVGIAADLASAAAEQTVLAASDGDRPDVVGTGFLPGESVVATLDSTGSEVGQVQADPTGSVQLPVAFAADDDESVVLHGLSSGRLVTVGLGTELGATDERASLVSGVGAIALPMTGTVVLAGGVIVTVVARRRA